MTRRTRSQRAYVVVRIDRGADAPASGPSIDVPGFSVTVKQVVLSQELAAAEVTRLTALNADPSCSYHWQGTHLFLDGGSFDVTPDAQSWSVWRQDDNGNRFLVSTGHTREEADALRLQLEARGHKQTYWTSTEPDGAT